MGLISFNDWLHIRESSPHTRWRDEYAKGNAPPRADVMSRSTPKPSVIKKAKKDLEEEPKKPKKKR